MNAPAPAAPPPAQGRHPGPPPAPTAYTATADPGAWPPFRTNNNRNKAESDWIAEIQTQWPNLTAAQQDQVRAHAHRWGPNQRPEITNNLLFSHEDHIREHVWHGGNRGVPRCNSCFFGREPMPAAGHIPIGLDALDHMPCGCLWQEVVIELWATLNNAHTQRATAGRRDVNGNFAIAKVGRAARHFAYSILQVMLGAAPTYDMLMDPNRMGTVIQARPPFLFDNTAWPPMS